MASPSNADPYRRCDSHWGRAPAVVPPPQCWLARVSGCFCWSGTGSRETTLASPAPGQHPRSGGAWGPACRSGGGVPAQVGCHYGVGKGKGSLELVPSRRRTRDIPTHIRSGDRNSTICSWRTAAQTGSQYGRDTVLLMSSSKMAGRPASDTLRRV